MSTRGKKNKFVYVLDGLSISALNWTIVAIMIRFFPDDTIVALTTVAASIPTIAIYLVLWVVLSVISYVLDRRA
jgi:hypothetical protein